MISDGIISSIKRANICKALILMGDMEFKKNISHINMYHNKSLGMEKSGWPAYVPHISVYGNEER